jgi:L-aminopeptidase/D-esterase-like protein
VPDLGVTGVPGIKVGHWTNAGAATGCTVVLCEGGAVAGVDVRGSAPGTRETDLLRPDSLVSEVHGVLLSGGSAFGLDAASGVMRYLDERGIGHAVGRAIVPIVPAAILFDLSLITDSIRPGPDDGYLACVDASDDRPEEGSVGAGTGATVAKVLGRDLAVKGGIGTASLELEPGVTVGAIMAVNAVGGVFEAETGELVAGPRAGGPTGMSNPMEIMSSFGSGSPRSEPLTNTTIGVVATNVRLTKPQAFRLATVAHDGLALAVRPAHTMHDGDTIFALATGQSDQPADMNRLSAAAVACVASAIVRGVREATGIGGIPSIRELSG